MTKNEMQSSILRGIGIKKVQLKSNAKYRPPHHIVVPPLFIQISCFLFPAHPTPLIKSYRAISSTISFLDSLPTFPLNIC